MYSRLAVFAALLSCLAVSPSALALELPSRPAVMATASDSQPSAAHRTEPDPRAVRVIADVLINGQGPFHFMLDTGASRAVLAESTATRLGLHVDPHKRVRVQGVNSKMLAPEVHLASLALGSLQWHSLDVPVIGGRFFDGLDGILGGQGLEGTTVSVSLTNHRCIISKSRHATASSAGTAAFQMVSERVPMISATLAGVPVQVVIDTGSSTTLGNRALLTALQNSGAAQDLQPAPAMVDITAAQQAGLTGSTPPLEMGQVSLQPPAVMFGDYEVFGRWDLAARPALLLGMDSLATLANFSIDYARLQLQLQPRGGGTGLSALIGRLRHGHSSTTTRSPHAGV